MTEPIFILYVDDQERSKNFYRAVLNSEPELDVPGMTEFRINGNCRLGIMPERGIAKILSGKTPHPETGNGIPRCELYLRVHSAEEYFSRAISAGAKFVSGMQPRDWNETVGYCADADGHILAFAEIR